MGTHVWLAGSASQQGVPKSVPVVIYHSVTLLDSAWTSVGTLPQRCGFEDRENELVMATRLPSWVGIEEVYEDDPGMGRLGG